MTDRVSDERLAEIVEAHQPKFGHCGDPCVNCEMMTPCETRQMAEELVERRNTAGAVAKVVEAARKVIDADTVVGIEMGIIRLKECVAELDEQGGTR